MKILIATGNQDKFKRIKKWLRNTRFEVIGFSDLSQEIIDNSKLSDSEERQFSSMEYRALAKVKKAISGLKNYPEELVIISTDEAIYLPWVDIELVDVRQPQQLMFNNEVLMEGVESRLIGADLANFYAEIADKIATPALMMEELDKFKEKNLPNYKFMPIDWKFTLAVGNNKTQSSEIISRWSWRQYIKNTKLPSDTPDTGYMIGKISSNDPRKQGNDLEFKPDDSPILALDEFFSTL